MSNPYDKSIAGMLAMAAAVVAVALFVGSCNERLREAERRDAFKAWVKMTGNTNHLSYEEWRSIVMATRPHNVPDTFIFIPR